MLIIICFCKAELSLNNLFQFLLIIRLDLFPFNFLYLNYLMIKYVSSNLINKHIKKLISIKHQKFIPYTLQTPFLYNEYFRLWMYKMPNYRNLDPIDISSLFLTLGLSFIRRILALPVYILEFLVLLL